MRTPEASSTYLGNGVYADYDGSVIRLTVGRESSLVIALEPENMNALSLFSKRCWQRRQVPEVHR